MSFHRPTRAVISLAAVRHNTRVIRKRIGKASGVMAIVKADAYGHGMIPVARASLEAGAKWLGVATVDEALAIRKQGIDSPLLILGPTFQADADTLVRNNISVAVGSLKIARALGKAAGKRRTKAKVHIKVDTGMGRFGFWWKELIRLLPEISRIQGITLEGCFTHFAVSDAANPGYTRKQHDRFRKLIEAAAMGGIRFPLIHCANSGAILQHPGTFYDMVRAGVVLYGMLPDKETKLTLPLKPVMTLTTNIIEIRTHPSGRYLSYGCTFRTRRKSRIAILPIGYADGISRKMSNRGEVIIRGCRVPIVGRVCMDQILVDVTDIPGARVGDPVLFWGKQGKNVLKAEEVAEWMETISYDVTCGVSRRVPRVYV